MTYIHKIFNPYMFYMYKVYIYVMYKDKMSCIKYFYTFHFL